jgi:aminomethyltransferase
MAELRRTVLHAQHVARGAKMVAFGGWDMPLLYPTGIVQEHLATRRAAGLFDVSHMGRFRLRGADALRFLQRVLTNNAAALDPGEAQYTLLPTETGGAVDDAYLYRFEEDEYLLVVNAANAQKDWAHLQALRTGLGDLELVDATANLAMLALQGPSSRALLLELVDDNVLPEPRRNACRIVRLAGKEIKLARTGYTGEPLCFELFLNAGDAAEVWDLLLARGATPIGLGARDTLRLEAGLPLYGHELGVDHDGTEVPIFACSTARPGVSFSPRKGDWVGREALARQRCAYARLLEGDAQPQADLPQLVLPLAVLDQGVARAGAVVKRDGAPVGRVTSGTMAPYWVFAGEGLDSAPTDQHGLRPLCLALVDSRLREGDRLTVEVRGREVEAVVVPYHLRSEAPPYARPILAETVRPAVPVAPGEYPRKAGELLAEALANTAWRQDECINLIPSEMTPSPMVRLLSVMDPAFRYAEHRQVRAFYGAEVFYYQGVDFIASVEHALEEEMRRFLGCEEVEARPISGQMANTAVYGGLLDYLNRADRKREPRRLSCVLNHHIGRGGHLSAQPMGALRDYVARDPRTDRPSVVDFPALADNPYQVDIAATLDLIEQTRPELILLGRSMVLHREPVAEIRHFLEEAGLETVLMYDMAHVLGLIGPHFQQPFAEGADFVTGSTHKTFFGTQRGVIGSRFAEGEPRYELWEAIRRRAFPGSVSNHHLGTLLGLLMATYEMNHFRDSYQPAVLANAKAFARALHACGLDVAGDPAVGYTETHQVIVRVGYGRGPELARRLEANNLICNYQATPEEEGFTASGALRLGVAEMTRFGLTPEDFGTVAAWLAAVVREGAKVRAEVAVFRRRFQELRYCLQGDQYAGVLARLHDRLR